MKHFLLFLVLQTLWSTSVVGGEPSSRPPSLTIPAWYAQAMEVALREFRKNQGGKTGPSGPAYGKLDDYTISISRSPTDEIPVEYVAEECVRLDFIPEFSEKDRRDVILGGGTSLGINVAYDVCKRTLKIVKTSFSR